MTMSCVYAMLRRARCGARDALYRRRRLRRVGLMIAALVVIAAILVTTLIVPRE